MIAHPTMLSAARPVVRTAKDSAHLADAMREEAAAELRAAFDGVSGERINHAGFPGISRHGISRAMNGCSSNPLYRLVAIFVLMKRCGLGKARAQRMVDALQWAINWVWGEEDEELCPKKVLDEEQRLDALDDGPQQRLAWGDKGAAVEMLEVKRQQHAHDAVVIQVLRRMVSA